MQRKNNLPTPAEIQELERLRQALLGSGPRSLEESYHIITGFGNNPIDAGSESHSVDMDIDGSPRTRSIKSSRRLDCGHVVGPGAIGAICSEGHEVCNRHPLEYCDECKASVCPKCQSATTEEGRFLCPDCAKPGCFGVIAAMVALIIIAVVYAASHM